MQFSNYFVLQVAACTWCAREAVARSNGAGCVKPNGHETAWALIGLDKPIL